MTTSPIRRMGASLGKAGGSLAELDHAPARRRLGKVSLIWDSGPLLVSVSGAPPTQLRAGPVSSGSIARSPLIVSQACLPHHGR
jgi:hypothetical protein